MADSKEKLFSDFPAVSTEQWNAGPSFPQFGLSKIKNKEMIKGGNPGDRKVRKELQM